jgi:hypothetical protein
MPGLGMAKNPIVMIVLVLVILTVLVFVVATIFGGVLGFGIAAGLLALFDPERFQEMIIITVLVIIGLVLVLRPQFIPAPRTWVMFSGAAALIVAFLIWARVI